MKKSRSKKSRDTVPLSKEHLDVSKIHLDFEQFLCVLFICSYSAIALQVTKEHTLISFLAILGKRCTRTFNMHKWCCTDKGFLQYRTGLYTSSLLFIQLVHSGRHPTKTELYLRIL
jgi:hypothetical protein